MIDSKVTIDPENNATNEPKKKSLLDGVIVQDHNDVAQDLEKV